MELRRVVLVALSILMAFSLVLASACGGKPEESQEGEAAAEQPVDQDEETPAEPEPEEPPEEDATPADEEPVPEEDTDEAEAPADEEPEPGEITEITAVDTLLMLNELNYAIEDWLGRRVWVLGIFADASYTGDGNALLVMNFEELLDDELPEEHTFASLIGSNMPSVSNSGAEVALYGEVQDYGAVYDDPTSQGVPLITVQKYYIITEAPSVAAPPSFWERMLAVLKGFFRPERVLANEGTTATQPNSGDRAVVISGGVNDRANYERYRDNIKAKYNKLREMGYTADQIAVLYANGGAINVTENVGDTPTEVNTVDGGCSTATIQSTLEGYATDMTASSTLTVFVTDHGTGYNPKKGYRGARPALTGVDAGADTKLYDESTFKIDVTKKVYRESNEWLYGGRAFQADVNEDDVIKFYVRQGGSWILKATETDGSVSEVDAGVDFDNDGTLENGVRYTLAFIKGRLSASSYHYGNKWDTDRDGTVDVRVRWDGTRYVVERLKDDGTWGEMGRDTNGDFKIDGADGGVDWNLDGDKNDKVGFHEGINMWGSGVLWDDQFADMLKKLKDKGIHILVEMVSCYSGGFVHNLAGIVDGIYTGSSEETPHVNRKKAGGGWYAADEMAFLENLKGIDRDSWMQAADKAIAADRAARGTGTANFYRTWQEQHYQSESAYQHDGTTYTVMIKIPPELEGKVYDFEIIFGKQKPSRWFGGSVEILSQSGLSQQAIAGGIRVLSSSPIGLDPLFFRLRNPADAGSMTYNSNLEIQLTDKDHNTIGYITLTLGEFDLSEILFPSQPPVTVCPACGNWPCTCP